MKSLDRYLRDRRIARAKAFVRAGDVILDVGCADGEMFEQWKGRYRRGVGVDPILAEKKETGPYTLYPGSFPDALPDGLRCDVVTMLAVLEHLPPREQQKAADTCHRVLNDGGRVVITVPSPRVDDVLHVLDRMRLIDGMSMHEHYGFEPEDTVQVFAPPRFRLVKHARFQLGLNNLFVFEKAA